MRFGVLGPLEVVDGDKRIALTRPRPRALLILLLLNANQAVASDRIIDALWGEDLSGKEDATLRVHISHLRGALEPDRPKGQGSELIVTQNSGYRLNVDPDDIDAIRFERLAAEGRAELESSPERGLAWLQRALELWRGAALEDVAYEDFAQDEIRRLNSLRLDAVEDRAEATLKLGGHLGLVSELESVVRDYPLRERSVGLLMLSLYRGGRQAEALRVYQRLSRTLGAERGLEPNPQLRRLEERMLQHDPTLELDGDLRPIERAAPLEPGRSVRGYDLREKIGEGHYGQVFRAYQASVGREVAIKAIRSEHADKPEFVRRFHAEAQIVAQLEHPYIVPLYDYWREPARAFLVMRWLRGGTVAASLDQGPWSGDAVLRVVHQVSDALTAAHSRGVIHRDIKPSNILFDGSRNAYVSDFGIALNAIDQPEGPSTDQATLRAPYASPEVLRREVAVPQSDVYSLGVLLHEMVTGRSQSDSRQGSGDGRPVLSDPDGAISTKLREVIDVATAPEPTERYPDMGAFADAVSRAVGTSKKPTQRPKAKRRNPYKGLASFGESDAEDFYGRTALVDDLVARIATSRLVTVVGPSGSGKSSLVHAGLVAQLRAGAIEGSRDWYSVTMTPGADPFDEFHTALRRVAVGKPTRDPVLHDERELSRAIEVHLPDTSGQAVLVIDQFEELFTMTADVAERDRFVTNLEECVTNPSSRIRVVATIRADFYDRPLRYRRFGDLVAESAVAVTPLTPDQLERAITGPAGRVGADLEPGLVAEIINDVADEPGALPLMQYALTELFDRRRHDTLTVRAYREVGGVSGALGRRADGAYASLDQGERIAARQMFLRMIALNHDNARPTRRRVSLAEIKGLEHPDDARTALAAFVSARLVTLDRDPVSRTPTAELAHEALITSWNRLAVWLDEAEGDLRIQRRLSMTTKEWVDSGRAQEFLLSGGALALVEESTASADLELTADESDFLEASVTDRSTKERLSRTRRRATALVLSVVALGALALAAFALDQRANAEENARIATGRELVASAITSLEDDPQLSLLLALQAIESDAEDGAVTGEAVAALHDAVMSNRVEWVQDLGSAGQSVGGRFSPDGSRIAAGSIDGSVHIYDAADGARVAVLAGDDGGTLVQDVRWTPEGHVVSAHAAEDTVRLWDPATGELLETWSNGQPANLDVSPDGTMIAISGFVPSHFVAVWEIATGEIVLREPLAVPIGIAFDPEGGRVAVASRESVDKGGAVVVYDLATGAEDLRVPMNLPCSVGWSPDGSRLVVAADLTGPRVLDAATGDELLRFRGHRSETCSADFSSDGERVVTGGDDGAARVWESATGREVASLLGHVERVGFVDFSPDRTRVLSTSPDGTIRVWDVDLAARRESMAIHAASVMTDAVYVHGTDLLLTGSDSGTTAVWGRSDGTLRRALAAGREQVIEVAASAAGGVVASASAQTITVWNLATGDEVARIDAAEWVDGLTLSDDGIFLAYAANSTERIWEGPNGVDSSVSLVNLLSDAEIPLEAAEEFVSTIVRLSPDGKTLAAASGNLIRVWDTTTGATVVTFESGGDGLWETPTNLSFDAAGVQIIAPLRSGPVLMHDATTGELVQTFLGHAGQVTDADLSPDGTRLATTGLDHTIRLWEVATGEETLRIEDAQTFTGVDFSEDGSQILVAGDFGVRVYEVETEALIELARSRLVRWWTPEECERYLHQATCPPNALQNRQEASIRSDGP